MSVSQIPWAHAGQNYLQIVSQMLKPHQLYSLTQQLEKQEKLEKPKENGNAKKGTKPISNSKCLNWLGLNVGP